MLPSALYRLLMRWFVHAVALLIIPVTHLRAADATLEPLTGQATAAEEEEPLIDLNNTTLPEHIFPELDEIIHQMTARAPTAEIAKARLAEAEGQRMVDRSASLPRLNGFAQYNFQTEQRQNTGTVYGPRFFWSINASQPVYQWGAIEARSQMGDLRIEGALTHNERSYRDLLRESRDLYLRIFMRRVSIQLAQGNLAIVKEEEARLRREFNAGQITEIILAEAEVRVHQHEADMLQQKQDLAFLENQLRTVTGWSGPILPNFSHTRQRFLASNIVEDGALPRGNPTESASYRQLNTEIALEERQYTIAQARNLPHFSAVAGIFQDQIDSAFLATSEERINYFVGGLVTWNLFDGHETTGLKLASLARRRQLERQAGVEISRFQGEADRLQSALKINRQSIAISQRLLQLSEERLDSTQRRHASGSISTSELLHARSSRDHSELSLISAKINYLNTLGDYLTLTGHDPTLQRLQQLTPRPSLPAVLNPWADYSDR